MIEISMILKLYINNGIYILSLIMKLDNYEKVVHILLFLSIIKNKCYQYLLILNWIIFSNDGFFKNT